MDGVKSPSAGFFFFFGQGFSQVRLEMAALVWRGRLDLVPDALYREIRERI
jgi:hypothetical protein